MTCGNSLTCFCGQAFSFIEEDRPAFTVCSETFVFVLGPFMLLAFFSSYYIGRLRPPDVNLRIPSNFKHRKMYNGITLLLTITAIVNDIVLFKLHMNGAMILSYAVRIASLLLHFIFLWRLGLIHFDFKRGPSLVTMTWLLTVPFYGVRMERLIVDILNGYSETSTEINKIINMFCVAGMLVCQVAYLVTVIQTNSRYRTVSIISADSSSTEDLLPSVSSGVERYYDVSDHDLPPESPEGNCPVDSAHWLSKLFFCWVQPLMRKGAAQHLQKEESVYNLPSDLNTENLCKHFTDEFQNTVIMSDVTFVHESDDAATVGKKKRNLLKTFHKLFGTKYYLLGLLKIGGDLLGFAGPILLNRLVQFVESDEPIAHGCYYALALFASTLIGSLLTTHFTYQVEKVGIAVKSSLIGSVYAKTMHSKPVAIGAYSTGKITNFMSTDINRVVNFCPSFHQFWSLPIQVAVTLVLLYEQVQLVFLSGLGLTLIMILFNRYLAKKIGEYNKGLMQHKDDRVKLMTEALLGIRVVKFNVWEDYLTKEINSIRSKELKSLQGIKYFDALCVYLWATTPVLISLLTFSLYVVFYPTHVLTAAKVFTVVALINMLISPLNAFPWVVNGLMEAWISLDRLEEFLDLPDFNMDKYYDTCVSSSQKVPVLSIDDGSFSWSNSGEAHSKTSHNEVNTVQGKDMLLQDISLKVMPGHFIGVVGTVGSGKSSLLAAVCAEMEKLKGAISLLEPHLGVALVSQEPWLQYASVRDNILWGQPYNPEFYDAVVECCALNEDFQALPHGDLTEVGENGVTLSGGQKARVSLARAVYQNKAVYLLDDPLSAVDQHVAAHLYRQCISGILRDRTRILCTHHVKYLKNADIVIEMEDGRIKAIGSPSEVLQLSVTEDDGFQSSGSSASSSSETENRDNTSSNNLMSAEEKASGTVALYVYKAYWLAVGGCLAFSILLFVVLMQGSKVASDWWLSYWVNSTTSTTNNNHTVDPNAYPNLTLQYGNDTFHFKKHVALKNPLILTDVSYTFLLSSSGPSQAASSSHHDTRWYLMFYGIIAASNSLFTLARAFLFAYGGIQAAKVLHRNLLKSILAAPISFFDVTPIGRIVNRFSSDMYTIDDSLPFMLNIFLAQLAGLIATVAVTCYGLPYFAILLIPLSIFYYYTQHYYRHTSRELKRLSSISLSPIYAHFTESLTGITTIRAFRKAKMFKKRNIELIDINQRCNFSTLAAQQWLSIRLQMMGVVMVTGVAFTAVLEQVYKDKSPITAGLVGLALSYALSVTGRLSGVVSSFTETEKQMVAVERQSYYIKNVPQERNAPRSGSNLQGIWPSGGSIEFRHLSLRYRPSLPFAIEDVCFKIEAGEKVGVVGRTGSGKSSLFLTLFGMVPTCGGSIIIDGVNIHKIPLKTLRSKMAIIPQDPFLFNGPIRVNLDPTGIVGEGPEADSTLWWALESCGLQKVVQNMGGLDADAGERGKRLSVGQRQLLCLARALLRDVQIVCLDEATANVDHASDATLQRTIRQNFSRRTVITIAHRIDSVLDSDRVLVMDAGRVAEFDMPEKLLALPQSLFAQLVQRSSGIAANQS